MDDLPIKAAKTAVECVTKPSVIPLVSLRLNQMALCLCPAVLFCADATPLV